MKVCAHQRAKRGQSYLILYKLGGSVTALVLVVARTERREARCGDGDDIRACCSRYGEEGRGRWRWGWLLPYTGGGQTRLKDEGSASRSCRDHGGHRTGGQSERLWCRTGYAWERAALVLYLWME